jgi:hypothetical protein
MFVTARTPSMRALFMRKECGHVVASATTPRHGCLHSDCTDPLDAKDASLAEDGTWLKLYINRDDCDNAEDKN